MWTHVRQAGGGSLRFCPTSHTLIALHTIHRCLSLGRKYPDSAVWVLRDVRKGRSTWGSFFLKKFQNSLMDVLNHLFYKCKTSISGMRLITRLSPQRCLPIFLIYTCLSMFSLQCFLWLPPHTLLKGTVPEACAEKLLNQFNLRAAVLHPAYRQRCCVQCWRDT